MREKIGYVYYAASLLGHTVDYQKAMKIADRFTLLELRRIYLKVKNTGRRVYEKAS
jgi:hypothetical protein